MAKKDVTLSREDWRIVYRTLSDGPNMGSTEDQARRVHLWQYLTRELDRDEDPQAIPLTSPQRRLLIATMENPITPWRLSAVERIWSIMEAFGWQRPDLTEYDGEEDA